MDVTIGSFWKRTNELRENETDIDGTEHKTKIVPELHCSI